MGDLVDFVDLGDFKDLDNEHVRGFSLIRSTFKALLGSICWWIWVTMVDFWWTFGGLFLNPL